MRARWTVNNRRRSILLAKLLGGTLAIVVLLEVLPYEIGSDVISGFNLERSPAGPQIAAVNRFVGLFVERIAVSLGPFPGNTQGYFVFPYWDVQHAFEATVVEIANVDGGHCLVVICGFGRNQVDHAGSGVAAVEGTLRTAQHFDLADVEKFLLKEVIANKRSVVERDGNGRIGRHRNRLGTDAADLDVVASEVGLGKRQVGYILDEIWAASRLRRRQLFLTECRDGDRYALHICSAQFRRGNSHRFNRRSGCGYRLRQFERRQCGVVQRLCIAADANGPSGMVPGNEAGARQQPCQGGIVGKIAAYAVCAHALQLARRYHEIDTGLRGIGVERLLKTASGNIERARVCKPRQ